MSYETIAELYDQAFDWESDPDVVLPVWDALGKPDRVIEAACGPARMLTVLVERGVHGTGVDVSEAMMALARHRLGGFDAERYDLILDRLETFAVERPCSGAFCAVGSFGHLDTLDAAKAHMRCMRRALEPDARYAVQMRLYPMQNTSPTGPNATSTWEFTADGQTLSYSWYGSGIDAERAREVQHSRIEWLTGPQRGNVLDTDHVMRIWDWPTWSRFVEDSGFEHIRTLDPNDGFHELALGESLYASPVPWHILRRR